MKKRAARGTAALLASMVAAMPAPVEAAPVSIRWFGHSCFLITSSGGTRILVDPPDISGYELPADLAIDVVAISHEHGDHAHVPALKGSYEVIRGLKDEGTAWNEVERRLRGATITIFGAYHDKVRGQKQGLTAMFRIDVDGVRILHAGDLGHMLTGQLLSRIGPIDVLMVPVGGKTVLSPAEAAEVIDQVKPRAFVIPMHGRTFVADQIAFGADELAAGRKTLRPGTTLRIDPSATMPREPLTVLLDYE